MEASKPTSKKRRKMDVYKFDDASSGDDGPDMDWVELGLMKPDITFFGEDLPDEFDEAIEKDRLVCDLMIVIGTSLKIAPVSEIIKFVPAEVPQILINRDPIYHGKRKTSRAPGEGQFEYEGDEFEFDICLFGQSDLILRELARRLGPAWPLDHTANLAGASPPQSGSLSDALPGPNELKQDTLASKEKQAIPFTPFGKHINHIWFFPGANTSHSWFERWRILEQAGANPHGDAQELSSSDEFHSPQLTKKEILSPAREDEAAKEKLEGSNTSDQQVQGAEPSKHLDISDHNARRVDYPSIEKAGGVAPVDLPGSKQADLKSEAVDTSKVKEIGPSIQQSLPQE
ncbi:hypothetical protein PCASD_23326 [Puccinia coronata f. sp. avenae]|nr:hypothetical protein PCASD_23326 [Puccinia coronata f. sp. avenae]